MSQELIELIRSHSRPMQPLPTNVAARLDPPPRRVKAVLFDVYGTLFASGSGDISLAAKRDSELEMRAALERAGLVLMSESRGLQTGFHDCIRGERERMQGNGIEFPEIEIREIWKWFLDRESLRGRLHGTLDASAIEALATDYECAVNPVWPMPGAVETIRSLSAAGLQLGIVSNAQFFTPLLFPALLGASLEDLGFRPDLCAWSYLLRRGKPDPRLFSSPVETLREEGVAPTEIVMVGNDMLNDIRAPGAAGLATALFAGDRRSLRLRESDERCRDTPPSCVLTSLSQLPGMVAGSDPSP